MVRAERVHRAGEICDLLVVVVLILFLSEDNRDRSDESYAVRVFAFSYASVHFLLIVFFFLSLNVLYRVCKRDVMRDASRRDSLCTQFNTKFVTRPNVRLSVVVAVTTDRQPSGHGTTSRPTDTLTVLPLAFSSRAQGDHVIQRAESGSSASGSCQKGGAPP